MTFTEGGSTMRWNLRRCGFLVESTQDLAQAMSPSAWTRSPAITTSTGCSTASLRAPLKSVKSSSGLGPWQFISEGVAHCFSNNEPQHAPGHASHLVQDDGQHVALWPDVPRTPSTKSGRPRQRTALAVFNLSKILRESRSHVLGRLAGHPLFEDLGGASFPLPSWHCCSSQCRPVLDARVFAHARAADIFVVD